jgi:hypothetical protein
MIRFGASPATLGIIAGSGVSAIDVDSPGQYCAAVFAARKRD